MVIGIRNVRRVKVLQNQSHCGIYETILRTKVRMEIVCMHKVRTQLFIRDKIRLKKVFMQKFVRLSLYADVCMV